MSTTTWTQYVAMDDAACELHLLDAALEGIEDWEDDFEIGDEGFGLESGGFEDFDDPE